MNCLAPRLAATFVAMVLLTGAALAEQPSHQPTQSHLAVAREVAIRSDLTKAFDSVLAPMDDQLRQMSVTRPEIKKDLEEVITVMKPEMELQKQQMINATARVFANRMSEAELREVAEFFKTPSGRKYVESLPLIIEDVTKEMSAWTQNVSEYVMIRVRAEMGKRGHQL